MGVRSDTRGSARRAVLFLGAVAALLLPARAVRAQDMDHAGGLGAGQIGAGVVGGVAQGLVVLLVGLVAFAAVVWIPASRPYAGVGEAGRTFVRGAWALAGALVVVGVADLSIYAARATGDALGPALFGEALFGTRTGWLWIARILLAGLTALAATWAARQRRATPWWAATGVGSLLLVTLAQGSHAAAEPGVLPLLSSWLHVVAASFWIGGLLGFPAMLLGPLRALEPGERSKLLRTAVRRFSKVATAAVLLVVATGLHATLLNVPSLDAALETAYGRALIMKLGLVALMLAAGGINLIDNGKGPLGRMVGAELVLAFGVLLAAGFLTTLPPASYASP
ncbi:hypothetical protein GBA65_13605 [Rubrobacter marinus]|uniref:Copper resistance protein D domain-containing protein n=1 Tax=Rubrobacter marinus TaxID=2653852 RepID=A0A6G8PYV0_9ACTN|nr:CopD family protein [Rubrobacter marinus]QIN79376.1 hypothetical protein GBA65_13605 [Rubrobacter marinus]